MRIRLIVTLSATAAASAFAQGATGSPRADSAFARGDWTTALPLYLEVARRDTTTPPLWFRLGVTQHGLGHFREAVDALSRAARIGAQPAAVQFRLAKAYAKLGDKPNAIAHLDSAARVPGTGLAPANFTTDPDFGTVLNEPGFKAIIARLDAARYPCHATPEMKQFDFWIGQWDVSPWAAPNAPPAAAGTNVIQPILEQCVLMENWTGSAGGNGKSMNFYDTNRRKWRQIWVADGSGSLDYSGEFRDGAMRFEGWSLNPQGTRLLQKLTFTPFGKDTVRQTFEASSDEGKTWTVTFDGRYVRHKP